MQYKNISDLKEGDKLYVYNEKDVFERTVRTITKEMKHTSVGTDEELLHITFTEGSDIEVWYWMSHKPAIRYHETSTNSEYVGGRRTYITTSIDALVEKFQEEKRNRRDEYLRLYKELKELIDKQSYYIDIIHQLKQYSNNIENLTNKYNGKAY